MASIKDIAKACGVSVATVSKALNGHNDISQATKEKVREAARQIGYMPNSAARALKTNRTYNLGVLFVDEAQSGLTHEFFAAVLDSFKRHAEGRGYDITFINHNIGHGHSSYLEHCRYRGVDGVIAACIFSFVGAWNNYFIPALIINDAKWKTVPILVAQLRSADFLKFDMGKVYMMITIAILPVMIVYLLLSKYIVRGVALGSVKG